jgi:hypothetical protein
MRWIGLAGVVAILALLALPGLVLAGPPILNGCGCCCGGCGMLHGNAGCACGGVENSAAPCEMAPGCCEPHRYCCDHAWDGFCQEKGLHRHCALCGARAGCCTGCGVGGYVEPQWCGVMRPRHCCPLCGCDSGCMAYSGNSTVAAPGCGCTTPQLAPTVAAPQPVPVTTGEAAPMQMAPANSSYGPVQTAPVQTAPVTAPTDAKSSPAVPPPPPIPKVPKVGPVAPSKVLSTPPPATLPKTTWNDPIYWPR